MCSLFMKQKPLQYQGPSIAVDYSERHLTTREEFPLKVMAWDTPGDRFEQNIDIAHCIRMGAIIFCYDPSVRETYLHIPQWAQEVESKNPQAVFAMVAISKDLIDDGSLQSLVPSDEACAFAESRGELQNKIVYQKIPRFLCDILPQKDRLETEKLYWSEWMIGFLCL